MFFSEFQQNKDAEINKILNIFNISDIFTNELYKVFRNSLAISGSTVLNVIKNAPNENLNDLDLYLNLYKLSENDFTMIINYFTMNGYREVTKANMQMVTDKDEQNLHYPKPTVRHLNKLYKAQYTLIMRIINAIKNRNNQENEYKYFSLKNHIIAIIRLYNIDIDKSIDLMILKPTKRNTIQKLIMETFDFDIIKNFMIYKDNGFKIYTHNYDSIINNKAVMTNTHFKNRIMSNVHEFNNFIHRYIKYITKYNCKVFIDKNEVTRDLFNTLIYTYVNLMQFTLIAPAINIGVSIDMNKPLTEIFEITYCEHIKFHTSNLRPYINENNDYFINGTNNEIYHMYLKYYIVKIIDKSSELYFPELDTLLTTQITKKKAGVNQCVICYNANVHLVDVCCGNGHKFCKDCMFKLIKTSHDPKCPYCRCAIFNN